jgi:hypothetical protein
VADSGRAQADATGKNTLKIMWFQTGWTGGDGMSTRVVTGRDEMPCP